MPVSPSKENHLISSLPAKFILLGEDDEDDEDFLREIIGKIDDSFYLLFVNNGRKVMDMLSEMPDNHLPCLIVLDYNMPELNGAEILKEMKKSKRYDSIPKVIWSTSGSETFKKRCLDSGARDYVIKPNNVSDFIKIAEYLLSLC